jgi:hypothetical protein
MKLTPTPDGNDLLKVRRALAWFSALYALVVWPNLLVLYNLAFGLPESILDKLLIYIGTLAAGPIGAYLWAAQRKQAQKQEGGGQ